jgi:hypothetical protein
MLIHRLISAATLIAVTAIVVVSQTARAESMQELSWEDLVPVSDFDDPFTALSNQQIINLARVDRYRKWQQSGKDENPTLAESARKAELELREQNVDIDGLLSRREEIADKRRAAASAVDHELDGRMIRMPGFLLPLDFEGDKVVSFLLVPTFGACIHTPPPPPNQIVHVNFKEGYPHAQLYALIWVEGRMQTGTRQHNIYLRDGSADVSASYSLNATRVEPYRKK